MSVIVMGSVSVFERDGIYQIYVTNILAGGRRRRKRSCRAA